MDIVEKLKALQTSLFDRGVKGGETISMAIGAIVQLESDRKRFESAYLGMRTERDALIADLRACCPPMSPGVLENEVTLLLKGLDPKRVKVWSERGKILRIDMLADDPIKEEAHNLAALHSLQGIPVDAIERVLREVRK